MIFWALVALAYAIGSGLYRIADAIRYRSIEISFRDPIRVESERGQRGP